MVTGSNPVSGATHLQTPQTTQSTTFQEKIASNYDTFKANCDTIKNIYKVQNTYYYRKRIKNNLFRISLRTKFLNVALQRKKILELLEDYEMFELSTKDYKIMFEYDTMEEYERGLEALKSVQKLSLMEKYRSNRRKLNIAKNSTNKLTFSLLEAQYVESKKNLGKVSFETIKDYIASFKLLKSFFEDTLIDDITLERFEEYRDFLNNGKRSNRTINKHMQSLKAFIKWAHGRNQLERDNVQAIEPLNEKKDKRARKKEARNYTNIELEKIFDYDYKNKVYNTIFKILAYTGMRSGELWKLQQENIKQKDDIYYFDIQDSKTLAGIREVPIHKNILELVLNTPFPIMKCSENAYQKKLRDRLYKAIKEEKEENDTLNVHTLRGTFIEHAVNANRDDPNSLYVVQEIVGHTKEEKSGLTLDTYMKGQELSIKQNIINNISF